MLVCRSWPGRGRADALDVLDRAAEAVLDHALRAGLAAQPLVVGELEAFLADVVDAGEPEQVPGDLAARVVAPVLAQQVDARDAERADALGVVRTHVTHEIDELAVEAARSRAARATADRGRAPSRAARIPAATARARRGSPTPCPPACSPRAASPLRSRIMPRLADSFATRVKRASPCFSRKPWWMTCR